MHRTPETTPRSAHRLDGVARVSIVVAWLGTYLPYTWWKGGAALSANVADLAEWVSLVPGVRYGPQPMLVPGLLRIVPVLFAMVISSESAALGSSRGRWALRGLAVLICIGVLPPFDFYRGAWDDVNYRNQFLIAIFGLMGVFAVSRLPRRARGRAVNPLIGDGRMIGIMLTVVGVACALLGYLGSQGEFARYRTVLLPGPGLVVSALGAALFVVISVVRLRGAAD